MTNTQCKWHAKGLELYRGPQHVATIHTSTEHAEKLAIAANLLAESEPENVNEAGQVGMVISMQTVLTEARQDRPYVRVSAHNWLSCTSVSTEFQATYASHFAEKEFRSALLSATASVKFNETELTKAIAWARARRGTPNTIIPAWED